MDIIYEDETLMVVNKPSNMLVIAAPRKKGLILTDVLNGLLRKQNLNIKAHPCHRLDYETSGVIVYAKGKKAQQAVMQKFHQQKVKKKYIAFVHGRIKRKQAQLKSLVNGKPSTTFYKVKDIKNKFTVVEAEPITGRTNQIRIQFKQIGYPLVGERRFAFGKDYKLKFRRVALHSSEISFSHPVKGNTVRFGAPLPKDMASFLSKFPGD